MNPAKKWQQMVLAQTIKSDPFDQHHILVIGFKDSSIDKGRNIHLVAFQQFLVHARYSFRGALQPLAFRIFAQC